MAGSLRTLTLAPSGRGQSRGRGSGLFSRGVYIVLWFVSALHGLLGIKFTALRG